jgi:N4-gp56 family major capsid protein
MAAPNTTTADLANLVEQILDQYIRLDLRSMPMFRSFVDTRAVDPNMERGSGVVFNFHQDLAPATTPIDEVTDPVGVSMNDTNQVVVTLEEYGNYTVVTRKLEEFAFDNNLQGNIGNIIAYNMADSMDIVLRDVLDGGTQTLTIEGGALTVGGTEANITATDIYSSDLIRYIVAKLRGANTRALRGDLYVTVVHPDVSHDIRAEAGPKGWRVPHEQVAPGPLYAGEIGTWESSIFVESPRTGIVAGGGAAGADVYYTYTFAQEAIAEAVAIEPRAVVGGRVVDPLDRKTAIGWHSLLGWNLFRPECMWLSKSASSIA